MQIINKRMQGRFKYRSCAFIDTKGKNNGTEKTG